MKGLLKVFLSTFENIICLFLGAQLDFSRNGKKCGIECAAFLDENRSAFSHVCAWYRNLFLRCNLRFMKPFLNTITTGRCFYK